MTKRGKRKICLLIDSESLEAILDLSFKLNCSLNQAAEKVIQAGLADLKIEPSEYQNQRY